MLFDEDGEGFIRVERFRVKSYHHNHSMLSILSKSFQLILKEMDDEISDDELDEIILEVC